MKVVAVGAESKLSQLALQCIFILHFHYVAPIFISLVKRPSPERSCIKFTHTPKFNQNTFNSTANRALISKSADCKQILAKLKTKRRMFHYSPFCPRTHALEF